MTHRRKKYCLSTWAKTILVICEHGKSQTFREWDIYSIIESIIQVTFHFKTLSRLVLLSRYFEIIVRNFLLMIKKLFYFFLMTCFNNIISLWYLYCEVIRRLENCKTKRGSEHFRKRIGKCKMRYILLASLDCGVVEYT